MNALRLTLLVALSLLAAAPGAALELLALAVLLVLGPLAGTLFALAGAGGALVARRRRGRDGALPRPDASAATLLLVAGDDPARTAAAGEALRAAAGAHGGDNDVVVVRSEAAHAALGAARHDVVVLLRDDVVAGADFLAPLLGGFDAPGVFAVGACLQMPDGVAGGKTSGSWRGGALVLRHEPIGDADRRAGLRPALWASTRAAAFDRRALLRLDPADALAGAEPLADVALCYRAQKRGQVVRFAAASRCRAVAEAGADPVAVRAAQLLLVWRQVTDVGAALRHFALLGPDLFTRASRAGMPYADALRVERRALLRALRRLPGALRARAGERARAQRSDRAVLAAARQRAWTPPPAQPRRRVLVMTPRLPQLRSDGSWTVFERLRELGRHHDVTLFSFVDDAAEEAEAAALRAFCARVVTHVRGAPDRPANLHHLLPYRLARDYSAASLHDAARDALGATDFDVVQIEYAEMAHLVHRDVASLPSIYLVHEPLSLFEWRELERVRGWRTLPHAFRWAQNLAHELRVLPRFRHLVTLSSADEDYLHRWLPALPITSIASGVDGERVHPLGAAELPLVAFVGYFRHPPNVDGALWLAREVFPRVREELPQARLRIVGKDPTDEMRACGALPGVEVTGFVPEVLPVIAPAAVIAVPIRLGGGLRGKMLEAWAAGKAVVTTSRGAEGFPVVHGENALVADDASTFAAHLCACLRDADLRRRLGARGRALVLERFTPAAGQRRYEAVYAALDGTAGAAEAVP